MANASQLNDWLKSNLNSLDLQFTKLTWPNDFDFEFYDFKSVLKVNNICFEGRGSSNSIDLSIEKSFTESVERYILSQNKNIESSNGLACHPNKENADKNAKFELIERDLFLNYFHSSKKFETLDCFDFLPIKAKKFLRKFRIELSFFSLFKSNNLNSVFCVASGLGAKAKFGLIFGFGTCEEFNQAVEKSIIELFRKISFLYNNNFVDTSISLQNFIQLKKVSFIHHGFLANNLIYANQLYSIFFNKLNIQVANKTYSKNFIPKNISVINLNYTKINELKGIPLYSSLAVSDNCQKLYTGSPKSKINYNRLSEFNENIEYNYFNLPHPLT